MFLKDDAAVKSASDLKELNMKASKILLSFVLMLLMAVSANIFIYLPFTPVPVTIQTLTVFFSAIILGSNYVLLTMSTYILTGLIGFPVFAGFKSGTAALTGPTGGFIIGFLVSSFVTALVFEKLAKIKRFSSFSVFIACFMGITVIYIFGYSHMLLFFSKTYILPDGKNIFINIFNLAIKPFLIADLIKIAILTSAGTVIKKINKL